MSYPFVPRKSTSKISGKPKARSVRIITRNEVLTPPSPSAKPKISKSTNTAKADAGVGRMIPMCRVERAIAEALGPNYSQEELKKNTAVTADYYTE
jgi:hypothetical protein